MKEINLLAGQFVNLSAQGLPNTKLLLQKPKTSLYFNLEDRP